MPTRRAVSLGTNEIGVGSHSRAVIDIAKFMRRLET
jgi:predicted thioesterase